MRILHLIPYMHPSAGGPPVVVDRWCVELTARGHSVEVMTTDAYSGGARDWIGEYSRRFPIVVAPKWGPNGFGYSPKLSAMVRNAVGRFDLVHVHNLWGYMNQLAVRECRRQGVPYVVSPHGMLDPHSMGRKPWKKWIYGHLVEWRAIRRAKAVIFTHAEEERLARTTCSDLPQGFVVPLGTEDPPPQTKLELTNLFLERFPQLANRPRVLFLSRLHPKKGLDLLLPAFSRLQQSIRNAVLVLVGPGELTYVESLKNEVAQRKLSESVLFVGPLHDVDKWAALSAAELFILPSYQENFAIAVAEAMRVGVAVVCSPRVNICDDIVSAGAAVKCELNVDDIARQMQCLLLDESRRRDLGSRAISYATEHFTWPASTDSLLIAYEKSISTS